MPQLRTSSSAPHSVGYAHTSDLSSHAGWSQIPHYSRIFGIETEYGIAVTDADYSDIKPSTSEVAMEMFRPIISRARSTNTYLDNGSRLYLDVGSHPEYATAEARTVHEAVEQDVAGERIMARLAQSCEQQLRQRYGDHTRIHVFKNNVDSQGHSFGCHENYLLRRQVPLSSIERELIPFLVTRTLFTGAGRVVEDAHHEFGFELAQRAEFLDDAISSATTRVRPMVNTRDEPHADSDIFRRLHVIVGDSNRSQIATWMKLATTHLVLCVIEASSRAKAGELVYADHMHTQQVQSLRQCCVQGDNQQYEAYGNADINSMVDVAADSIFANFQLADPAEALRQVSRDRTGKVQLQLAHGETASALDIQFAYLAAVRKFVRAHIEDSNIAFPGVDEVLHRWQQALEAVCSGDWQSLSTWVDWAAKLRIIQAMTVRARQRGQQFTLAQAQQIDMDYHDIVHSAVYPRLVAAGQMEVLVSDEQADIALHQAPRGTRAQLRAAFIRAARATSMRYSADWTHIQIHDPVAVQAELLDPFNAQPTDAFDRVMHALDTGAAHIAV